VKESLAIIVLSRDRPDLFAACAASLPDAPYVSQRILVNNGTDGQTVRSAMVAGWQVIDNRGENLSFSAGNNLASRTVGPSVTHLLLLNNDVTLHGGSLDAMWAKRGLADAVGAFLLQPSGCVDHAGVWFNADLWPVQFGRHQGMADFPEGRDMVGLPAVTFACAMVSRAAYDAIGGLDERYWYCLEDVDFCLRLRQAGGSCAVARDAVGTHVGSATVGAGTFGQNRQAFSERWHRSGDLLGVLALPGGRRF
jgi:GT2 family glycosyltransferase